MPHRPGRQWAYWACAGALDNAVTALTAKIEKVIGKVVGKIVGKIDWRIVGLLGGLPTPDSCGSCGVRNSSRRGRLVYGTERSRREEWAATYRPPCFKSAIRVVLAQEHRRTKRETLPRLTVADLSR